jgi:hypothetical protein
MWLRQEVMEEKAQQCTPEKADEDYQAYYDRIHILHRNRFD